MTNNNKLGLIVAYYLSRFDKAYLDFGYSSFNHATREIGKILDIKPRTIQNFRDELDPWLQDERVGWNKKVLAGSRKQIIQAFQDLDRYALKEIVDEILNNPSFRDSKECHEVLSMFSDREDTTGRKGVFIVRGKTGLKAESFFMDYFVQFKKPEVGRLIDRRQDGCGYDFEIAGIAGSYFVEVKGSASNDGGILFTDKEWFVANAEGKKYILALVIKLDEKPEIYFIYDPASIFSPIKNIYRAVRIDWPVPNKAIQSYLKNQKLIQRF
jgi:hypothetical protein